MKRSVVLFFILIWIFGLQAYSVKIKDISYVSGEEKISVVGYGLVIGLSGTGDRYMSLLARQSVSNMLEKFGILISPDDLRQRNVASVMVTAKVPKNAPPGYICDISVSSIGEARSLEGGYLLMSFLKDAEGKLQVEAQGRLSVYEKDKKKLATGIVYQGGRVVNNDYKEDSLLTIYLYDYDYNSLKTVIDTINNHFPGSAAFYNNGVKLTIPSSMDKVSFLSQIGELNVDIPSESKVVINRQTGMIVSGLNIVVNPVVISFGDMQIEIGDTTKPQITQWNNGTTVGELSMMLNQLGLTGEEIVQVFELLKSSGALKAEVVIE